MAYIPLNRQFIEWRDNETDELSDPDIIGRFGGGGFLDWADLLKRRRVVILAEAGSGKSEELKDQANQLADEEKFVFIATVEDVARDGLEYAISRSDRARLSAWSASDQPAWFFIDSIDEAKFDGYRFERALKNIADGIYGAEGRAHIILSGRHTDWEFRHDLVRLQEIIPIPAERDSPPAPDPNELLIRALHNNERQRDDKPLTPEAPLVVTMSSLDAGRVRLFAKAKGAPKLDAFVAEIDTLNLWQFARRPLDLDWLVQFWISNGRLGTLEEMLATSLRERLRETVSRAHRDSIGGERGIQALERVGAALVFGRALTLAIPDSEVELKGSPDSSFNIADVLPDWSGADRVKFLSRPVFDPATFGRVRLHNDNEGDVRAYLAARWLLRLRRANLSRSVLFSLLFADTYGVRAVKPSLHETAAWLSLWDPDVAREVIDREPYLLLTGGDPAGLPLEARANTLTRLTERIVANDENVPVLDHDSVKRFARPDIAATIRQLWPVHKNNQRARALLLRLIWLGELRECSDLAAEALKLTRGEHDQTTASRAFLATANENKKREYAGEIVSECVSFPKNVLWDAIAALFPSTIGADQLLSILSRVDISESDGGAGFQWFGPNLVRSLESPQELERMLIGLLDLAGPEPDDEPPVHDGKVEALLLTAGSVVRRLMELGHFDSVQASIVRAAVRIGMQGRFAHGALGEDISRIGIELRKTIARRRLVFWQAAEQMHGHSLLQHGFLEFPWQMEMLGWPPGLSLEDVDWLLDDINEREKQHDCKLAVNSALFIWERSGRPSDVLERIKRAAATNEAAHNAYDEWMRPRPANPRQVESERRLREARERNKCEQAARDQSWVEFIRKLKADPRQLREAKAPSADGVDSRVYHLWKLLSNTTRGHMRYSIGNLAAIEPIIGAELTSELRHALIAHWRSWNPCPRSALPEDKRNIVSGIDIMGLTGISLEANASVSWVDQLDANLAHRAVVYATLEINGFPPWIADLSAKWPEEVAAVLLNEVVAGLQKQTEGRIDILSSIERADNGTLRVMTQPLLTELEQRPDLPISQLRQLLEVLEYSPDESGKARLRSIATARFLATSDIRIAAAYISTAFSIDPEAATDLLTTKLDSFSPTDQAILVQNILPSIFGGHYSDEHRLPVLSFRSLERLVELAFKTIRAEDDNRHSSGEVYSPDARDEAEGARDAGFKQLTLTPGLATYNALLRLSEQSGFAVSPPRLRALARVRASVDSESAPWPPSEAAAFEEKCEGLPQTNIDLQRLLLARLSDIQHSLLNDDFAQGATLQRMPSEMDVQTWFGHQLRSLQGRSYTVEREPHVVDEKEPDVRARSANDSNVPIEIKVAESWTLGELEEALSDQLCGRYLRSKTSRHGILLLVHQQARTRGWTNTQDGRQLSFDEVVEYLRRLARSIAGSDPDAPQPEVAVIDVSSCDRSAKRPRRQNRSTTKHDGKTKGSPKRSANRPAPKRRKTRNNTTKR